MSRRKRTIDITPSWEGVAPALAQQAVNGDSICIGELIRMAKLADKCVPMIAALKVLTLTPSIRIWLSENDPKALAQAEAALEVVKI